MTLKSLKNRLWWFDVVYPITVACLLFGSLTSIVYSGSRSSRLSLMAENQLLGFSEKIAAGQAAHNPQTTLIVTADAIQTESLGRAPRGLEPDIALTAYAQVLHQLTKSNVPLVFMQWNARSHPSDASYYQSLTKELAHAKHQGTKVYLTINLADQDLIPASVRNHVTLLDNFSCLEENELQSFCTYNPEWKEWVFVALIKELMAFAPAATQIDRYLTKNLPTNSPGLIMSLPSPYSMQNCSFQAVIANDCVGARHEVKVAFVGTNMSGEISPKNIPGKLLDRVRSAYDDPHVAVEAAGTPKHQFWAMAAQKIIDGTMILSPNAWLSTIFAAAVCALILWLMITSGGPVALGAFLVFLVSGPFINSLALEHLSVYIPLFDAYYFGMSTLTTAGFARLSFTAFQRWRLQENQRMHAFTADLKGNFISLLSHNLNTPVAKMQGLLELLSGQEIDEHSKLAIKAMDRQVARMEYAIRTVLVASAAEEKALSESTRSLKSVLDELRLNMSSSLRRYGVRLAMESMDEVDPELLWLPLKVDARVLHTSLAAAAALFAASEQDVSVSLSVDPQPTDQGIDVEFTFESKEGVLPPQATRIFASPQPPLIRSLGDTDFTTEVLAGLVRLLTALYRGKLHISPHTKPQRLSLKLHLFDATSA